MPIRRKRSRAASKNGVRTIEHGNLIDDKSAKLMAERKALMVANLVTYYVMKERGRGRWVFPRDMLAKNELVIDGGLKSLEICKRAGVPVAYGSDLLGKLQVDQSREFLFRAEVLKPIEIIRQATLVGADVVRQTGKLGVVEAGRACGSDRRRRRSAEGSRAVPGSGQASARHHEGRRVSQERAQLMARSAVVLMMALSVGACAGQATPKAEAPATCGVGEAMAETQLYFGLSKPKGGTVSAREWEAFVAEEITPRFPEGFSVIDGAGFWRDGATQKTISEKSKVVVRLHPRSNVADTAIGEIIAAYKTKFEQEAVLRVERPVCAQF